MARKKQPANDKSLSINKPSGKNAKPQTSYPLQLTQLQRQCICKCNEVKNAIRVRLQESGDDTQIIAFSRKELEHLNTELLTFSKFSKGPDKTRLGAVLKKIADFLDADQELQVEESSTLKTEPAAGEVVYQFKITLQNSKPEIWRRIQVQDCTLAAMHNYIQAAFGWEDCHLHEFSINGIQYGQPDPDPLFDLEAIDENEVFLSNLIPKSGRTSRWLYTYDFGDQWEHMIAFEGFLQADPKTKYPFCVDGARACPPEDCGGYFGFSLFLEALSNPKHSQHKQMMEWHGPFDPLEFDAKSATKVMWQAN